MHMCNAVNVKVNLLLQLQGIKVLYDTNVRIVIDETWKNTKNI